MNKFARWFIINNCISTSLSIILDSIMTFYLLKNGFSLAVISLCFSISLITTTIIEFPSGMIADRFGRKKTYSIGLLFRATQCLILLLTKNTFLILMSGFFEGIHNALVSGSLESWLFKELDDKNYDRLFGLNKICTSIVSFIFVLVIAYLISDSKLCILLCFIAYILSAITNIFYLDDNRDETSSMKATFNTSLDFIKESKARILMNILIMFYGVISVYMLLFQAIANRIGLEDSFVLLASLFSLTGSVIAGYVFSKATKRKELLIMISLIGVSLSFLMFILARDALLLLIGNILYGFSQASMFPYFYSELFKILPDQSIASNISIISAVASLFAALLTYFLGLITEISSLTILAFIGVFFAISCVLLIKYIFVKRTNVNA